MKRAQIRTDKFGMILSLACIVHCFFVPSFVILTSGFYSFSLDNEFVHKLLVSLAFPISGFALLSGYKFHQKALFLFLGILGLSALIVAVVSGESMLGEFWEKALTLMGSVLVVIAHFKNYQICKSQDCVCHDV